LNRSSYEIGKEYLRKLKASDSAKEKYKQSLVIEPRPKIVY